MPETTDCATTALEPASPPAATVALDRGRRRLRHRLAELCGVSDYRSASTCDCDENTCAPHSGARPLAALNARETRSTTRLGLLV